MAVVANIAVNLDATRALAGLKGLDTAVKGLGSAVSRVGQAMSGLAGIAATIGAGAAVSGFVKAGIEADRTGKTIKALAGQYQETEGVTKLASEAAKQFGLGQTTAAKAVADLYGRLRPMGVSLDDIGKTFNGVNKAAGLMNLTAADTEGVMLQLSQAMGSGRLQGDELRSIMERLPAVGQAVAKVMGVTVGQIKQLGADGKITTDVIIKAMDELNKIQPPPPDPYKRFQAAIEDLNTAIGTQLLPIFTPLVQKLTEVVAKFQELGVGSTIAKALTPLADVLLKMVEAFMALDPGIQATTIQIGAFVGAISLIVVPLGMVVSAIGTLISAVGAVVAALGGMSVLSSIAGWLGAVVPAITAVVGGLQTLGAVVIGVFSGPVGWIALAAAAGIAIYAFRDDITKAFKNIVTAVVSAARDFYDRFVQPVIRWAKETYTGIVNAFRNLGNALAAPFTAVANMIRGIMNQILGSIGRAINGAVGAINSLIRGANTALARLRLPQIPFVNQVNVPQFAEGGLVTRPTLAMVGEGGEPEYIVPQSKASAFAQNWISGARGTATLNSASSPTINIQTGPVMQQDGKQFVTIGDLENAMQAVVTTLLSNGRTTGGRRYAGVR